MDTGDNSIKAAVKNVFVLGGLSRPNEDISKIVRPGLLDNKNWNVINGKVEENKLPGHFFWNDNKTEEWLKVKVDVLLICRNGNGPVNKCIDWFERNSPDTKIINIDYYDTNKLTMSKNPKVIHFKRNMVKYINGGYPAGIIDYPGHTVHFSPFCVREDILKYLTISSHASKQYDFCCMFDGMEPSSKNYKDIDISKSKQLFLTNLKNHMNKGNRYHNRVRCPWALRLLKHDNCWIGKTSRVCQEAGRQGTYINDAQSPLRKYIDIISNSRIIITANPCTYEGDYRLMEALSTGAMVMHNRMGQPPHGLEDGVNWVMYDDSYDMIEKLLHYLEAPEEVESIGKKGRELVLEKHLPKNRSQEWYDALYT